MIRGFSDRETERIWIGQPSRWLPANIQRSARRKLRLLNRAISFVDLRVPAGNRLEQLKGDLKGRYSLRINDQWRITFAWSDEARTVSGSRTTIAEDDWLPNVHPGEILREDFLVGSEIAASEVADGAGIPEDRLAAVLAGVAAIDAGIDLCLGRYFGMSDTFFLGLQADYDVEEFKRAHGDELDRIVPRAA